MNKLQIYIDFRYFYTDNRDFFSALFAFYVTNNV